jgi:hypothetical protein
MEGRVKHQTTAIISLALGRRENEARFGEPALKRAGE